MSQMNNNTVKNLYEYATYFKRILQLTIVSIIVGFLGGTIIGFGVVSSNIVLITFGGVVLLGVVVISIVSLIFQVMMFIRLANAKNSSSHLELAKSFNFFMISLILTGVGVVISIIDNIIAFINPYASSWTIIILSTLASLGALIGDLVGWQALGKYIAVYSQESTPSQGFLMVADGIKTYIITVYIVITARILSFVVGIIGFGVMLVGLVSLVASIIMIVSQFKIANGMLMVFGGTSLGNYSTEPTPEQAVTTPLQGSGSSSKFCSKCGGKLLPDAKFCPSCGQTIK